MVVTLKTWALAPTAVKVMNEVMAVKAGWILPGDAKQ